MDGAFVIQLHQQSPRGDHYDLMLEEGPVLATFELPCLPQSLQPGQTILVPRLADHRPAYLTYEGEVPGGRGHVHIVDRGRYAGRQDGAAWVVELAGGQAAGSYRLEPAREGLYRLTRLGE